MIEWYEKKPELFIYHPAKLKKLIALNKNFNMFKLIKISPNFISENNFRKYRKITPQIYRDLMNEARKAAGKIVIHINSTPSGGGVAEILKNQVPLENSLGIRSYWLSIKAPRRFFVITKKIHNFLQGKTGFLTEKEKKFYLTVNSELGKSLKGFCQKFDSGIVVIHDPQPLPMIVAVPENFSCILRLHIDLSTPNQAMLEFLKPFIIRYSSVVLSDSAYRSSLPWIKESKIISPAINPFNEKNQPMDRRVAEDIIKQFGINPLNPIISQIARFDPWKDPLGVMRAYYLAKNKIPNLQLVLAGLSLATDDPEALTIFEKVKKRAKGDPHIYLFFNPKEIKDVPVDVFINALYTVSSVIIQKSLREGFGLSTTEAMWKGKPVIAGLTKGASLQIKNGRNGILVSCAEEAARAIIHLIKDKKLSEKIGRAAVRSVKQKFLFSRFLLDNLKLYNGINK